MRLRFFLLRFAVFYFFVKFVKLGKMLEDIRHGADPTTAYNNNIGTYGRFDGAAKYIDPREE